LGLAVGAVWLSFESLNTLLLILAFSCVIGSVMGIYYIKEPLITLERHALASFGSRMLDWTRYIPTLVFGLPELLDFSKWRRLFRIVLPHFYLSAAIILTVASMFFTPLPTYFESIQLSESMIYLLFIVHNLTATVTFIFDRMISSRANEQRLVHLALIVRFTAFFIFSIASTMGVFIGREWIISIFLLFTGASWALFWAPLSSYISKIADTHRLGEAQGALNASVAIGSIVGSVTSGYLIAFSSYQLNFLISSLVILAGLLIFLRVKQ
jgi:MFS family permease